MKSLSEIRLLPMVSGDFLQEAKVKANAPIINAIRNETVE
jgi:hypothetical protein